MQIQINDTDTYYERMSNRKRKTKTCELKMGIDFSYGQLKLCKIQKNPLNFVVKFNEKVIQFD